MNVFSLCEAVLQSFTLESAVVCVSEPHSDPDEVHAGVRGRSGCSGSSEREEAEAEAERAAGSGRLHCQTAAESWRTAESSWRMPDNCWRRLTTHGTQHMLTTHANDMLATHVTQTHTNNTRYTAHANDTLATHATQTHANNTRYTAHANNTR